MKYIYYCRAMDGLDKLEIKKEYDFVQSRLSEANKFLVNTYSLNDYNILEINKDNSKIIVKENQKNISKSDCLIVNLSIPNHSYIGCISEMTYAKETKNCYIITIVGDSGNDNRFYTLYYSDIIVKTIEEAFDVLKNY